MWSRDADLQLKWSSFCESKLRHLIPALEQSKMVRARLLPVFFEESQLDKVIGSSREASGIREEDWDPAGVTSRHKCFVYVGMKMYVPTKKVQKLDLSSAWRDFLASVKRWDGITSDGVDIAMMVCVQLSKRTLCAPS